MEVTLKNFLTGEVTKQQVFDFVMKKLIEQGEPSTAEDGSCAYATSDGKHCAIGWLCLDLSPLEGAVASAMFDRCSNAWNPDLNHLLCDKRSADEIDRVEFFLDGLQGVHDGATEEPQEYSNPFVLGLKSRARRFANEHHLDASVLAEGAGE